jgi:hypothetical protein
VDPLLAGHRFSLADRLEAERLARFGSLMRLSDSVLNRPDRTLLLALGRERNIIPALQELEYAGLREPGPVGLHDCLKPWMGHEWVIGAAICRPIAAPKPVDEVEAIYHALPAEAWRAHSLSIRGTAAA